MSMPGNTSKTRAEIIRQFLPTSPYAGHLGIQLIDMQPDVATLRLPFADSLITIGTIMHGGAIASLIERKASATESFSDCLVTETHSQDRHLSREVSDHLNADSCFVRRAGSGGYDDFFRPHLLDLVDGYLIVTANLYFLT